MLFGKSNPTPSFCSDVMMKAKKQYMNPFVPKYHELQGYLRNDNKPKHEAKENKVEAIHPSEEDEVGGYR